MRLEIGGITCGARAARPTRHGARHGGWPMVGRAAAPTLHAPPMAMRARQTAAHSAHM